tara:strand:- start:6481 stop:6912 length:432 start_codon:yes stop_codon:yes gene_type:complete
MVWNFVESPHIVGYFLNSAKEAIKMSNDEENRAALIEKANKWLENPPADCDEYHIEDVKQYVDRLHDKYTERAATMLHTLVKGARNTITLTQQEMKGVIVIVDKLEECFEALPHLSIPREKNRENIEKSVIKAVKKAKGENNV